MTNRVGIIRGMVVAAVLVMSASSELIVGAAELVQSPRKKSDGLKLSKTRGWTPLTFKKKSKRGSTPHQSQPNSPRQSCPNSPAGTPRGSSVLHDACVAQWEKIAADQRDAQLLEQISSQRPSRKIVKDLLVQRANPEIINANGDTLLKIAESRGWKEIEKLARDIQLEIARQALMDDTERRRKEAGQAPFLSLEELSLDYRPRSSAADLKTPRPPFSPRGQLCGWAALAASLSPRSSRRSSLELSDRFPGGSLRPVRSPILAQGNYYTSSDEE